jgi:hypothetical protein
MSKPKRDILNNILDRLEEDGVIEPCGDSQWASCPVLVKKKPPKDASPNWRLCIDYRVLNSRSNVKPHSMPRIDYILSQLGKAKVMSTVDLAQGYHQIAMKKEQRQNSISDTNSRHLSV